jgi:hypothetical protein
MTGFQWVLLNPWAGGPAGADKTFVARRGIEAEVVHSGLRRLEGEPGAVTDLLYFWAVSMVDAAKFDCADDEQTYRSYWRALEERR